ncbi:MAG: MBL fold metallo-hydrolase [Rhodobiaceae bacterium]|nr:MBL fold metallo-hydrolase [Rhodobiaceae bacterium]MCC0052891.1 MBL fold metallo-hydrolase [Rhodobiaceae bacterium]
MSLRITILGCGSSGGVPRVGNDWGACDPNEPRNRRLRCSVLVERAGGGGTTRLLVDTSPDLREQLLAARVDDLDAVVFTHDHADHTHGIDDLRPLVIRHRKRIPVYADDATANTLDMRFGYCFSSPADSIYPPILDLRRFAPDKPLSFAGAGGTIEAVPVPVEHGPMPALGFRFGTIAYVPDVSDIPPASATLLKGLDVLILDALRYKRHISHLNVEQAVEWIARLTPRRAVLTNLHCDIDHATLKAELPDNIGVAHDMLRIEGGA